MGIFNYKFHICVLTDLFGKYAKCKKNLLKLTLTKMFIPQVLIQRFQKCLSVLESGLLVGVLCSVHISC